MLNGEGRCHCCIDFADAGACDNDILVIEGACGESQFLDCVCLWVCKFCLKESDFFVECTEYCDG